MRRMSKNHKKVATVLTHINSVLMNIFFAAQKNIESYICFYGVFRATHLYDLMIFSLQHRKYPHKKISLGTVYFYIVINKIIMSSSGELSIK